jgi:ABC-2 type transport system permease protein
MQKRRTAMKNLLNKEFRLVINPLFFLITLFGALLLIPQWVFLVAPMYLLFIAIPNIISAAKAQKDIEFTVLLPVRKSDAVRARVLAIAIFQVAQIFVVAIFAALNIILYHTGNFLIDTNVAYIGCVFAMYGVFNVVFFPMLYKTAYKLASPLIVALIFTLVFATVIELLVVAVPAATRVLDGISRDALIGQIPVLVCGIAAFILLTWVSMRTSIKRFSKVNL